jgi:hypothetical protein
MERRQFDVRLEALRLERSSFTEHWRELSEYILPRQSRFFLTDRNRGDRRSTRIIDNTATEAAGLLSSGMMSGITNPAKPWFQLRTADPDLNRRQDVREWLDAVRDRMVEAMQGSNLYTVLPAIYRDLGVFATSACEVLADDRAVFRCHHWPVGSYMLGTSYRGNVDTAYRESQMTAAQMVAQFGEENCSDRVKAAAKDTGKDQWFDVVRAVEPNPDHKPGMIGPKGMAWRSVYYEPTERDRYLRVAGFEEFSVVAPRWDVSGEDIYGTSCPGMVARGDVIHLQHMSRRKTNLVDLLAKPPVNAPMTMQKGVVNMLPGGVNFYDVGGTNGVSPAYQVDPHLGDLREDIATVQDRIRRAFFVNLFLMITMETRRDVTAQEILARNEEKMMVLGPVLTRVNDELLDPLVERIFGIMDRAFMFPEPPEDLADQELVVEYVSILHQALKMSGISGVQQLAAFTTGLAGAYPEVLDTFDADESVIEIGSMLGVPAKLTRDKDQRAKIRAARADAQQAEQTMAMAQQGAETAKVLADTQVGAPSALSALMGGMG